MVILALILLVLLLTARWWLPPLLAFVGANSDTIQGLEALVQLVLLALAAIAGFLGLREWRKQREPISPVVQMTTQVAAKGQATVITQGGPGQIAVGKDNYGDIIYVADPDQLWKVLASKTPTADLRKQTEAYLKHLVASYRYLDFRGMGMVDRLSVRLPLLDMYVPLKARVEAPEGETWTRELRLAGRRVSQEEAESIGQRVSEPMPVLDLLRRHDGLIILGDPGAGKTTFLKYLTLLLALGQEQALDLPVRLPVLVPLSAYANALAVKDVPLDRFVNQYFEERGIGLPVGPMLQEALARGGALLLLDGLDEVKDLRRRRDVVNRVVDFFTVQRQRGNKFVLTSRIVGYPEVRPRVEGLAECTLIDFGDEEIALFVQKWTQAIEQAAQGQTPFAVQVAELERTELLSSVGRNAGVRRLASNPLLLTVLALMKRQGKQLPERRVELYEQYVTILLNQWNLARGLGRAPEYSPDVKQVLKVLAPLALWMHETSPGVGLVKEADARRKLQAIYAGMPVDDPEQAADRFLSDVRDYANLLVERGSRMYGFIHLTFQEYLAGVAIAQQGQQSIDPVVVALAAHLGDDNWREVSLLAIGTLGIVQQRDEAASAVLLRLIEQRPGQLGEAAVLAGQAVLDVGSVGVTPACRQAVIASLEAAMPDRSVPARLRLHAGLALADLGMDPPGLDDFVATAGWGFAIGRYPVTNRQFRRFMEAGGYTSEGERRWWTQEGLHRKKEYDWQMPRYWDDDGFNHSTQPVVGVSWYEANAYCAWLTSHLRDKGILAGQQEVRLPTQAEWEQAALSSHGRAYPWGEDDFDPTRANTKESGLNQTTPVHTYPSGRTPDGLWDLAGNVWELASDVDKDVWIWLKGGAWLWDKERAKAAARHDRIPGYWHDYIGFRVLVVPIPCSEEVLISGF